MNFLDTRLKHAKTLFLGEAYLDLPLPLQKGSSAFFLPKLTIFHQNLNFGLFLSILVTVYFGRAILP